MKYSKDLLKKHENPKSSYAFAVLSIILGGFWLYFNSKDGTLTAIDWLYSVYFFFMGLVNIMAANGYSVSRLIGKALISIDDQMIRLKTGVFEKEQSISWTEIDSINYKANNFIITKKDNSVYKLVPKNIKYSIIQEMKNAIQDIADTKSIAIIIG